MMDKRGWRVGWSESHSRQPGEHRHPMQPPRYRCFWRTAELCRVAKANTSKISRICHFDKVANPRTHDLCPIIFRGILRVSDGDHSYDCAQWAERVGSTVAGTVSQYTDSGKSKFWAYVKTYRCLKTLSETCKYEPNWLRENRHSWRNPCCIRWSRRLWSTRLHFTGRTEFRNRTDPILICQK